MLIEQNDRGLVEVAGNELSVNSIVDDPSALRLSRPTDGSLGKVSFNHRRDTGIHDEVAMVQGLTDERMPGQLVGEVAINVRRPRQGSDDGDMLRAITIRHDGIHFHLPVTGLPAASTGAPSAMVSPDGRYRIEMQPDGNFVVYDAAPQPPLPGGGWKALWSWMTGVIR